MGRIKGKPVKWEDLGFKENTYNLMRQDGEIGELIQTDELQFKKLSRRYFESRNVYENRVLAQRIGVESATTLSKQELIEKLLDKVWGVQYFSQGFKCVKEIKVENITAEIELALLEDVKCGDVIIGEESEGIFESRDVGGVLWDVSSNFDDAIVDTYVLRNLVGEYALKDGDKIKGRARYVDELGFYCLFHIDEINDVPLLKNSKRPCVEVKPVRPYEKLTLSGNDSVIMGLQLFAPVCYGQFGVVSTNGRIDFCEQAIKIFRAVDKKIVTPHLFVMGEKEHVIEKTKETLYNNHMAYYSTLANKNTTVLLKVLQYVSTQAKENGSKHLIIINDLDVLDKTETKNGVSASKLASFAGAYSNGGSVTIIAMAGTSSPLSAYHSVRNVIDFELALKSNVAVTKTVIDMLSSYSFSDRSVSKEETVALAKLEQIAITEGNNALQRRLSGYANANEIIAQLNDQ